MPTSAGSGIAGSPRRVRHRKPRPLGARLHHWGPPRVANLFVALASWHSFALFRRQTREKEGGNETKRIASARDEGSPKGEGITRVVTSASRRRASRKTPSESRKSHTRIASTLFAVLRAARRTRRRTRRARTKLACNVDYAVQCSYQLAFRNRSCTSLAAAKKSLR